MTRFGLIARADNRGLGQQTWAVHRNLQPHKTLVVDCPSEKPLRLRLDRFPNAQVCRGFPTRKDIDRFVADLDVVYTAETAYGHALWDTPVRTVLHANYEFLDRKDRPTVWAAPSLWHFNDFPDGTVHLPVPIETDRFIHRARPATAQHFLHVIGRPAIHDRNGTADFLKALTKVTAPITVTVACQESGYVGRLLNDHKIRIPSRINFTVNSVDVENYWDNYHSVDALIMPRRFGGLCLPANEALGAGIPAIMPDISPNNLWLPKDWLTPASKAGEFDAKQRISYYQSNPEALAERIDRLATDPNFYTKALAAAANLRHEYSWETLKPRYEELLCSTSG